MKAKSSEEVLKLRIYFHSPLPPVRSGIADYSAELLAEAEGKFDIVLINYGDGSDLDAFPQFPTLSLSAWKKLDHSSSSSSNIYQVGNNLFHWEIIQSALLHPGIVVIHDGTLSGVLSRCSTADYIRFCEYELGIHSRDFLKNKASYKGFEWQDFTVKNLGLLVDSSLSVLVHSKYLARLIRRRYRAKNVVEIGHHLSDHFKEKNFNGLGKRADEFLERHKTAIKIGTFGFLTPPKRIDWLVAAYRRLLDQGVDAVLLLAGEPHPDTQISKLIFGIPSDRVFISGFISEEEMIGLMSSIDIQVTLRFPSVGESSGTLTRALGLGALCVVLAVDAFSDYSDSHVIRIKLDGNVSEQLYDVFAEYRSNPNKFRAIAEAGRTYIHEMAKISHSLNGYKDALDLSTSIALPSDYYHDLSDDIAHTFGSFTEIAACDRLSVVGNFIDHIFCNISLRDLAQKRRLDIVWIEDPSNIADEELITINQDQRKIFFVAVSHSDTEVERRRRLGALRPKRFDIFCFLKFPGWCTGGLMNLPSELSGSSTAASTSVKARLPQFVTRRVLSHVLRVGAERSQATGQQRLSSLNIPLAITIAEVL